MNGTTANDGSWALRYESLRQHVLGEQRRFETAPLGLLLVIRQGLAGWMRAWRQEPPSSTVRSQATAALSVGRLDGRERLVLPTHDPTETMDRVFCIHLREDTWSTWTQAVQAAASLV